MQDDSNSLHSHSDHVLFSVHMEWTCGTFTLNHTQGISKFIWKIKFQHRGFTLPLPFPQSSIYTVKESRQFVTWPLSTTRNPPCLLGLWRRGPPCFQPDQCHKRDPPKGFPYSGFSLCHLRASFMHPHASVLSEHGHALCNQLEFKHSGYHNTQLSDPNRWHL